MSEQTASAAPTRLADLKPRMKLAGTVKKVELFGAFVDVGVGRDGLVHISALKRGRVKRVEDLVKEGDQVTVWVRKADPGTGRIELTMIEPLALEWHEIKKGAVLSGKVVRLEKYGAFVDVGASRPGLIHVSELTRGHVSDPGEILKIGDEVEARVLSVNTKKKQLNLSLKALEIEEAVAEEVEEEMPTAMELALRAAMQASATRSAAPAQKHEGAASRKRKQQEDLLNRTLRTRRK